MSARNLIAGALYSTLVSRLSPIDYIHDRILKHFGPDRRLWDYQQEIIEAICDPLKRKVAIVCSRQAGKTEAVSLGALYLVYNYANLKIGFFAPKEQQAAIDVNRIKDFIRKNKNPPQQVIKENATLVKFGNGSEIHVISASDQAEIEGLTFDVIILEESQKISDYTVSERILPMGGATNAKLIQIGTPKARNHFYRAFNDPTYTKLKFDWLRCHNLHKKDTIWIGERKYGKYVLSLMPRPLKQDFFSEELAQAEQEGNQEVIDVLSTEGEMSIEDFKTQYMIKWQEDAGAYMSLEELKLLKDGTHSVLNHALVGEEYYAGIDLASSEGGESDSTAISVWRRAPSGVLEKVFFYEMYGINYGIQIARIKALLFNEKTARFIPRAIFADYTSVGRGVVDQLNYDGMDIIGITFNKKDDITKLGTNFKSSMFHIFKLKLIHDQIKYPARPTLEHREQLSLYRKGLDEWSSLESKDLTNGNKKIHAPEGGHDDHACADVLAVYAASIQDYDGQNKTTTERPRARLANFSRR